MKPGAQGRRHLRPEDVQPHKAETFVPKTETLDPAEKLSPEEAIELGNRAMEQITWRLPSKPFGIQAYALQCCGDLGRYGFFLEQGLGKTKTTLADFWNRFEKGLNDSMVVFTVNSMKLTWEREAEQEGYPFDIHVWPNIKNMPKSPRGQVIIINYDASRLSDQDHASRGFRFLQDFMVRAECYVAFDESTCLMNHGSQQSAAGVQLSGFAKSARCLAGRPNPMGPHNLWPQLKALGAPVGNYYAFRNTFCQMGGYQGRKVVGAKNTDRLLELMKPRCLFASKRVWAPTLPEKKFASLYIELTEEQKKAYKTMAEQLFVEIDKENLVSIERGLHKGLKLQQITSGFIYDDNGEAHWLVKGEPSKLTLLKDFITNATGKTIIFAHFQPTLELLLKTFPGAPHALSKSRQSPEELEEHKARFNSDDCDLPFIASDSVLKFGHTLVGTPTKPCENVVFYENTYSLLTRTQGEDRAHRWGAMADNITYWDLIASGVDRDMVNALRERGDLSMAFLSALEKEVHRV